ncbi:MAG: hypothetical protein AAFV93_19010 [Chloroflexota bacterium]
MRHFLKYCSVILVFIVIAVSVSAQDNSIVTDATQQLQGLAGQFWERIQLATEDSLLQIVLIIGGAIMLLIGWRIYNFVILIAGALSGALLAVALVGSESLLITIFAMLIGGAIGGFLAIYLYYLAVFAIGAYVGVLLTLQILSALTLNIDPLLAMIFGAIMGGLIMLGLSFELLVVISSIVGGQLLSLGLGLDGFWTLGFIAFGVIWQITLAKVTGYKVRRRPTRRLLFRDT